MKNIAYYNLHSKLDYFFSTERKQRVEVKDLLTNLCNIGNPLIFGGMLRDIALGGNKNFYSDVDIVMTSTSEDEFKSFMSNYNYKINSFGGFRINLDYWPVDIWRMENTWAFKESFVSMDNDSSLLETTFFNWDAIFYNYKEKNIVCKETYFSDLSNRILDINFEKNPNLLGTLKRTVKFLKNSEAKATRKLCTYFVHNSKAVINSDDPFLLEIRNISDHMEKFLKTEQLYFKLQTIFEELKNPSL